MDRSHLDLHLCFNFLRAKNQISLGNSRQSLKLDSFLAVDINIASFLVFQIVIRSFVMTVF